MKGKIYLLTNGMLNYVGMTTRNLNIRYLEHLKKAKKKQYTSYKLFESGKKVSIELLEEVEYNNKTELIEKEKEWINKIECVNVQFKKEKNNLIII